MSPDRQGDLIIVVIGLIVLGVVLWYVVDDLRQRHRRRQKQRQGKAHDRGFEVLPKKRGD